MKKLIALMLSAVLALTLAACGNGGGGGSGDTPSPSPSIAASDVRVGDTIQFGGYDWRVLDVQGDRALIVSDRVLEDREYHSQPVDITWEHSDIRQYLNGEFYNSFSPADQARIVDTNIINNDNPWTFSELTGNTNNTHGGNNTTDKIFLLSIDEVIRYFGDSGMLERGKNESARNHNLEYPEHGIYYWGIHDRYSEARIARDAAGTACWWWLRSLGLTSFLAAYVSDVGDVGVGGVNVNFDFGGVRPALWLSL
jgi:hypothetical protein